MCVECSECVTHCTACTYLYDDLLMMPAFYVSITAQYPRLQCVYNSWVCLSMCLWVGKDHVRVWRGER